MQKYIVGASMSKPHSSEVKDDFCMHRPTWCMHTLPGYEAVDIFDRRFVCTVSKSRACNIVHAGARYNSERHPFVVTRVHTHLTLLSAHYSMYR